MTDDCMACGLLDGTVPLPGGPLLRTGHWAVEHSVGPLGLGTLIVKPVRHVTGVDALSGPEAAELGPLLARTGAAVRAETADCEQVYVCLWSHKDRVPGHLHFVVQPARTTDIEHHGGYGPQLQLAQFQEDLLPDAAEVEEICVRLRERLARP
ncbi:hypothetical protein ACFQVC_38455 [Streptomyces monticola]|uniref:HIT family protein n=1 Tax=Streptomyces monticola TaxID=2666263 RepID=A0ABW2JX84_9ACTN